MSARLLHHRREELGAGEFTEVKAWMVEPNEQFPEGLKISFAYVKVVHGQHHQVYRMDNAHGRGLHEHVAGRVSPLPPLLFEEARALFRARVASLREGT